MRRKIFLRTLLCFFLFSSSVFSSELAPKNPFSLVSALRLLLLGSATMLEGLACPMVRQTQMSPELQDKFDAFQLKYQKTYPDCGEYLRRQAIFAENFAFIEEHNQKGLDYELDLNRYSDQTWSEFKEARKGFLREEKPALRGARYFLQTKKGLKKKEDSSCLAVKSPVPDRLDWREHGAVSEVKNQGECGSCWTFSAVGALEGAYALKTGKLQDFSEQELVDCQQKDSGCDGGLMDDAFAYAQEHGLCLLKDYPYEAKEDRCQKTCQARLRVSSYHDVKSGSEKELQLALTRQPISIAIEADQRVFQFYKKGILSSKDCGRKLDHGVLLVGYGRENNTDYWIIKNSWGKDWGEGGYIRLLRQDKDKEKEDGGECGLALSPSYPCVEMF